MSKTTHGGPRDGAGRKSVADLAGASRTVMKSVKLTPAQWEKASRIGGGVAAEGIRRAIDGWDEQKKS